ncbi:MAG: hypothetical protein QG657_694 [Acidobacteriota bacterium]|nr:hypothetical protein [Acidobacteriota bacterium]
MGLPVAGVNSQGFFEILFGQAYFVLGKERIAKPDIQFLIDYGAFLKFLDGLIGLAGF